MAVATLEANPAELAVLRAALKQRWAERGRQCETDISPLDWAKQNTTIVLPTEGRKPFEPYDYQERFLADDSPRRLILKARQVGMSNVVAIEALHKSVTRPDRMILMVSRNGRLAQQLITYCRTALSGMRELPKLVQENLSELAFANGSRIVSLPAGPSAGRGFPASDVYLDEFAFLEYADLIYEAIVPTLGPGGQLSILSTPNGRANLFFRLWHGLEGGEWSKHEVHWSHCPRYDEAWAASMRANMTRQSFAQEYDLDFVSSGDAVFDADDLAACRVGHIGDPIGCDRYVTAWDIGRRQDHTVGTTIGRRAGVWHVVKYERFLEPYPVVQQRIELRAREFRGIHLVESNGVGDPVIENLNVNVEPFQTTTKSKVQAVQALQLLIQQGRFKHDEDQIDRELSLYQWDDAKLIQDSVMSLAIAATQTQASGRIGVWSMA